MKTSFKDRLSRRIKNCIRIVIIGLLLSGITAYPIESELHWLVTQSPGNGLMRAWLQQVYQAVHFTNQHYPYLSYGTDWLAFAHILLAILFAGALRDPQRNVWVLEFGVIAAVGIFPLPCYFMIKKLDNLKNSR
jgi:hypothetical protein